MATTKLRKRDTGERGNGGQFATTIRPDAPVEVPKAPAEKREIVLSSGVKLIVDLVESRFDAEGRTVVSIRINREQLATSGYRQGAAPWDIYDEDVTDEQVDAYLEQCSDGPETFGDELGFPGEVRWHSGTSTLELTHTGYEGVSDQDLSTNVSATLGDFRRALLLRDWS